MPLENKSPKIEYIFLNGSLVLFNQDLSKLSNLVNGLDDEQCYDLATKIETIKDKLTQVEEQIKETVLQR
jgi:hypothetical protein